MVELLKFEYYRILKSVFIWILVAIAAVIPVLTVMSLMSIISMIGGHTDVIADMHLTSSNIKLANWFVISALYERLPIAIALFVPLFLGRDYKDGFIRNKLTAGHTRLQVYSAAAITQVTVTLALSFVYILFAIIALAFTPIEVNLNGGEMLVRAFTLILSLCATTLLFCALSFVIKSRAGAVVLAIVFVLSNGIFSLLSSGYNYNRRMVHEYVELYNEVVDDNPEYNYEKLDEDAYFNVGWYIGHPIFILTNSSLPKELMPQTGINALFGNDFMEYPKKVYRNGFSNSIIAALTTHSYMAYMIDSDDINDIDGVTVKVEQVELEYNMKSICWGIIYFAGGYALFRKKNIS